MGDRLGSEIHDPLLLYANGVHIEAQGCEALRVVYVFIVFNPEGVVIAENRVLQSLAQIYLHIAFSTQERRAFLQNKGVISGRISSVVDEI